MTAILEFLIYGVPCVLLVLWAITTTWQFIADLRLVKRQSPEEALAEIEKLPPFERIKAMMSGSKRAQAEARLENVWDKVKPVLLWILAIAFFLWAMSSGGTGYVEKL